MNNFRVIQMLDLGVMGTGKAGGFLQIHKTVDDISECRYNYDTSSAWARFVNQGIRR